MKLKAKGAAAEHGDDHENKRRSDRSKPARRVSDGEGPERPSDVSAAVRAEPAAASRPTLPGRDGDRDSGAAEVAAPAKPSEAWDRIDQGTYGPYGNRPQSWISLGEAIRAIEARDDCGSEDATDSCAPDYCRKHWRRAAQANIEAYSLEVARAEKAEAENARLRELEQAFERKAAEQVLLTEKAEARLKAAREAWQYLHENNAFHRRSVTPQVGKEECEHPDCVAFRAALKGE